jgi:hypothetical protein
VDRDDGAAVDDVGSADVCFHLAITGSVGSARLDRAMRALPAGLRDDAERLVLSVLTT